MHAFPPASKLPPLKGDVLSQLWLDPYGVRFRLESGLQLYVEYQITHIEQDGTVWSYDCAAANGPALVLHRLLRQRISDVKYGELKLSLFFEGGDRLDVLSEVGPFECGHFETSTGEVTIVF